MIRSGTLMGASARRGVARMQEPVTRKAQAQFAARDAMPEGYREPKHHSCTDIVYLSEQSSREYLAAEGFSVQKVSTLNDHVVTSKSPKAPRKPARKAAPVTVTRQAPAEKVLSPEEILANSKRF